MFGSLFGAGVFVTTCVAGAVSIAQPFKLMERPFLRCCYVGFVVAVAVVIVVVVIVVVVHGGQNEFVTIDIGGP